MSGRYSRGKLLGRGAYAAVYAARDTQTRQAVAIKLLDLEKASLDSLQNELRVMRLCNHDNLVRLVDTALHQTQLHIVMELCDAGTLTDLQNRVKILPEPVAAIIFHQLCSALLYLHSRGWIHQDVKAGNILLDLKGTAKLCDFGLAQLMSSTEAADRAPHPPAAEPEANDEGLSTPVSATSMSVSTPHSLASPDAVAAQPTTDWQQWFPSRKSASPSSASASTNEPQLGGTPFYMAPEVVANKVSKFSAAADVWSAGIVWLEMLTGQLPHGNLHPMRAMVLIVSSEAPRLSSAAASEKARALASRCLQKDPTARTTAAQLLKDPLVTKGAKRKPLTQLLAKHMTSQTAKADESDDDSDDETPSSRRTSKQSVDWYF